MINGKASVTLNLANIRCDVCDFLWPRAHAKTSSTRDPSRGVARALAPLTPGIKKIHTPFHFPLPLGVKRSPSMPYFHHVT